MNRICTLLALGLTGCNYGIPDHFSVGTQTETGTNSSTTDVESTTVSTQPTASSSSSTSSTTAATTSSTTAESTSSADSDTSSTGTTTTSASCNENLTCDESEDFDSCPLDCATCTANGECDGTETPRSCPQDCPATECEPDGVIDPLSEQCDDNNSNNTDNCINCNIAVCGDGFVHKGAEDCDDGNIAPGDGCDAYCARETLHVFVSSTKFPGNLNGPKDGLVGLDLADDHCQKLADTNKDLQGTFKAWLSANNESAKQRLGIQADYAGHFILLREEDNIVAKGGGDLLDGSLGFAIDVNESGMPSTTGPVWTNTNTNGTSNGQDCSGWTLGEFDLDIKGNRGVNSANDEKWTDLDASDCDAMARLYCFQAPTR